MTAIWQPANRGDRWADWAVVTLVVLALAAGLALRGFVLSRTEPFTLPEAAITGRHPANWVQETGEDPLLRVRDPLGGSFDTVLELRRRPLSDETPNAVLEALALERAEKVVAYESLETDRVAVAGESALRRTFTYVHVNRNPYINTVPTVVRGIDVALQDGDRLIVVTLLAEAENLDAQERRLVAFVESLAY